MAKRKQEEGAAQQEVVQSFKGFDANLQCRGFQYEIGGTYEHEGKVEACEGGFHACEHPLDVFSYYPPAGNRFAAVEQSGVISRHDVDTKVASQRITVKAELTIAGLIQAAVDWTFSRATKEEGATTDKDCASVGATGDRGAASATGKHGAAMASGRFGQAMGADGCALFLVERDRDWVITAVWAGIAGRDGIKANTFYTLTDGKPVEVSA